MAKLELKIPMLGVSLSNAKDMKDKDAKSPVEKKKRKEIAAMQPTPAPSYGITAGNPIPKTSRKELLHDAIHDEIRHSFRKWIAGEIDTDTHKENLKRGKNALSSIPKIREGGY